MKFLDAYILARTKRKTRRIRTALVVVASSLLFAVLFGGALVTQGAINAGDQVADVGFNSQNLASVRSGSSGFDLWKINEAIEGEMDAELRDRGIEVTEKIKEEPDYAVERSKRFTKVLAERQAVDYQALVEQVQDISNPTALYEFTALPLDQSATPQPDLDVDPYVEEVRQQVETGVGAQQVQNPEDRLSFYKVEQDMMRTQLYPGQTFDWEPGQPYPIVISLPYLEKLAERSFARVSAEERNAGYRELMREYAGKELPYCYRNAAARDQIQQVVRYNAEAETDDSLAPIDIPVCGGFDQQLLEDKNVVQKVAESEEESLFPQENPPAPATELIHFKIVGYAPHANSYNSGNIISNAVIGINILPVFGAPGIMPAEVASRDSLLQSTENDTNTNFGFFQRQLFANFSTRDQLRDFVDKGCVGNECTKDGSLMIQPFGNLTLALEGMLSAIARGLLIGTAIIMVIAALLIMFTISKVISDSTKEIAVFRSLGARRRDIVQIYYFYGMMLTVSALVLALVLAAIGAYALNRLYGEQIATAFVQATGAYNTDVSVNLIAPNALWLAAIAAALVLAAIIGIAVPVFAAVRRKLAAILREE